MQLHQNSSVYNWNHIVKIVLEHKKQLFYTHVIAILATLASVPVPLLMPLLVDEVLLDKPGMVIHAINQVFPTEWQLPSAYIGVILLMSLLLRIIAIIFNIIQSRQFSYIAKDIVFRFRKNLLGQLQTISMAE